MTRHIAPVAARCTTGLRVRPVAGHDARIVLVER